MSPLTVPATPKSPHYPPSLGASFPASHDGNNDAASKLGSAHATYETRRQRQGARRRTGYRGVEPVAPGLVTRARVTCLGMSGVFGVGAGAG